MDNSKIKFVSLDKVRKHGNCKRPGSYGRSSNRRNYIELTPKNDICMVCKVNRTDLNHCIIDNALDGTDKIKNLGKNSRAKKMLRDTVLICDDCIGYTKMIESAHNGVIRKKIRLI